MTKIEKNKNELICNKCKKHFESFNTINVRNKIWCKRCFIMSANGQIIEHKMPGGELEEQGIILISNIIDNLQKVYGFYSESWPDDWNWDLIVNGKGKYVGSLAKRIAKFVYNEFQTKLNNEQMGEIGSIIGQYSNNESNYYIDFVDEFNWEEGDFGDYGSCYWGCRFHAREILANEGCLAIRFYNKYTEEQREKYGCPEYEGMGRAWLMPKDKKFIVFNGYGLETLKITRILANFLNKSYKRIELKNQECDSGYIYINNGSGYIIGQESKINEYISVDLNIEINIIKCKFCGDFKKKDEIINVEGFNDCCQECYTRNFCKCGKCEKEIYIYDESNRNVSGIMYCNDCFQKEFYECPICGNDRKHDKISYKGTILACNNCQESIHQCNCGIYYYSNKNNNMCGECMRLLREKNWSRLRLFTANATVPIHNNPQEEIPENYDVYDDWYDVDDDLPTMHQPDENARRYFTAYDATRMEANRLAYEILQQREEQ